jgi:hypothetical protein
VGAVEFGNTCERFEQKEAAFDLGEYQKLRAQFRSVCDYMTGEALPKIA